MRRTNSYNNWHVRAPLGRLEPKINVSLRAGIVFLLLAIAGFLVFNGGFYIVTGLIGILGIFVAFIVYSCSKQ